MASVDGSRYREPVAPFSMKYAQRISQIHELRAAQTKANQDDILHARAVVGSTFRVSGADHSRSYSTERSFGPARPLSVGRSTGGSRSNSAERSRNPANTSVELNRTLTSFDKELQIQKDIAAVEKQKLALLQLKKESYINYLKNKGNTPWIPGGDGAKHENSSHRSINRTATEQRMLQRAWCRSPWPGSLPAREEAHRGLDRSALYQEDGASLASRNSRVTGGWESGTSPLQPVSGVQVAADADQERLPEADRSLDRFPPPPPRPATSPQRIRSGGLSTSTLPAAASVDRTLSASTDAAGTGRRVRADSDAASSVSATPSSVSRRSAGASGVSKSSRYVALTVRLIDATHSAQKSSYGVFIVPRHCTRWDLIANVERQFNVPGQVSDISITYRSGYSHGVVVQSLSMGTLAEVPQLDDYSSITIYLRGSTTFDSQGNITTHPQTASALEQQHRERALQDGSVLMSTVLPSAQGQAGAPSAEASSAPSPIPPVGPAAADGDVPSPHGLRLGDNLLLFDDADSVVSIDAARSVPGSEVSRSSRRTAGSAAANGAKPGGQYQVPAYTSLHPDQPAHGFSYASPARQLLDEGGKADQGGAQHSPLPSPHLPGGEYVRSYPVSGSSTGVAQMQVGGASRRYEPSAQLYMFEGNATGARASADGPDLAHDRPSLAAQRPRRDWLQEAEVQLQMDAQRGLAPALADAASWASQAWGEQQSPAYRGSTASSVSRRREKVPTASTARRGNDSRGRVRSRSVEPTRALSPHSSVARSQRSGTLRSPRSPHLSVRTTASSRGRSAFIMSRAGDLGEVNRNLYGHEEGRRRSSSVGRDGRVFAAESGALPLSRFSRSASASGDAAEPSGGELAGTEAGRNVYATYGRGGGLGLFVHGKVFSRSSEELDGLQVPPGGAGIGTVGLDALRAPTPLFGPAGGPEGMRTPLFQSASIGEEGDVQGRDRTVSASSALSNISSSTLGGGGGGAGPSVIAGQGMPEQARGVGRVASKQLARNLEELLEEMS